MSTTSKVILGLSIVLTIGTVAGVHFNQLWERQRLREGVVRDLERVDRKRQNLHMLEQQIQLTNELLAERKRQQAETTRTHDS